MAKGSRGGQTRELAEFVAGFPAAELPAGVLERARRAIADVVGVALAGRRHPIGEKILAYVEDQGARPVAGIFGGGASSPELAALANGTLGHALDFDDTNHPMYGHPSCHLVPAGLAVGEEAGASFVRLLAGFAVGFEVDAALGGAMNMAHYEAGFHATGTIGSVGAAATAARVLGLDVEATTRAIGIAATRAAGLRVNVGTMCKPLHAGGAAMAGVQAARLAARGWDAHPEALEAGLGFCSALMGPAGERQVDFVGDLGKEWSLLAPYGLAVKPFPTCGATHPAIHAAIALHEELGEEVAAVHRVRADVTELATRILVYDRPRTGNEGRFSYPYTIAAGLARGRVGLADFTAEAVAGEDVGRLLDRIEVAVDPSLPEPGEFPARIEVETADGRTWSQMVPLARGKNANPMSEEELFAKFDDCVGSERAAALWKVTRWADEQMPLAELTAAGAGA